MQIDASRRIFLLASICIRNFFVVVVVVVVAAEE